MEENEVFRITAKGKEDCLRMIDGVPPSDLGLDFPKAAIAMYAFIVAIESGLKENPPSPELKGKILDTLEKARNLRKSFWEAARLTKEWTE